MDDYRTYKNSLVDFEKTLSTTLGKEVNAEFERFALACVLRAWGSNELLYSEKYPEIIAQIFGKAMSREDVTRSMQIYANKEKTPAVPPFFKELVEIDKDRNTTHTADTLGALYEFLALITLLNGDFTMQEAEAIDGVVAVLKNYANGNGLAITGLIPAQPKTITGPLDQYTAPNQSDWTPVLTLDVETPADAGCRKNGRLQKRNERQKEELSRAAGHFRDTSDLLNYIGTNGRMTDALNQSVEQLRKEAEALSAKNGLGLNPEAFAGANGLTGKTPEVQATGGNGQQPKEPEEEPLPERSEEAFQELMDELNGLVGLDKVKEDVRTLLNFIKINKLRQEREMKVPKISYHLVFTGNPGTGKTTVARIIAKLYYQMGILPKGQMVEADRGSLVAGYLGQTAIKTQEVIDRAMGGVLFIDEAYALANDEQDSYGKEAIETLLKAMEDHRDELVVIVAGYTELMHKFINSNPGLNSRFNKYFLFPDYTGPELKGIFDVYCRKNGYKLTEETAIKLEARFGDLYESRNENFGNGRDVRNIFEKAINHQANRLAEKADVTDEELQHIAWEDLEKAMEKSDYEKESEKVGGTIRSGLF